jgi:hypothetical protein
LKICDADAPVQAAAAAVVWVTADEIAESAMPSRRT